MNKDRVYEKWWVNLKAVWKKKMSLKQTEILDNFFHNLYYAIPLEA